MQVLQHAMKTTNLMLQTYRGRVVVALCRYRISNSDIRGNCVEIGDNEIIVECKRQCY